MITEVTYISFRDEYCTTRITDEDKAQNFIDLCQEFGSLVSVTSYWDKG